MNLSAEHKEMLLAVRCNVAVEMFPEHDPDAIRAEHRRLQNRRHSQLYRKRHHIVSSNWPTENRAEYQQEEDARSGSGRLYNALQRLFRAWEDDNGFVLGAGQILLPAGYAA